MPQEQLQAHRQKAKNLLRKAVRLYEICLCIDGCDNDSEEQVHQWPRVFDLAVINNLGVALEQLGEVSKAKECYGYSLRVVVLMMNNPTHNGTLDQDEIHGGFLYNALRMVGSTAKVAPAA